jgi:hypothetical protein
MQFLRMYNHPAVKRLPGNESGWDRYTFIISYIAYLKVEPITCDMFNCGHAFNGPYLTIGKLIMMWLHVASF